VVVVTSTKTTKTQEILKDMNKKRPKKPNLKSKHGTQKFNIKTQSVQDHTQN
jgi:hypothetical protein